VGDQQTNALSYKLLSIEVKRSFVYIAPGCSTAPLTAYLRYNLHLSLTLNLLANRDT